MVLDAYGASCSILLFSRSSNKNNWPAREVVVTVVVVVWWWYEAAADTRMSLHDTTTTFVNIMVAMVITHGDNHGDNHGILI